MVNLKLLYASVPALGVIGGGSYFAYSFIPPRTIDGQLRKEGLYPIDTNRSSNENDKEIKKLIKKYVSTSEAGEEKIPDLVFVEETESEDVKQDSINALKEKCESLLAGKNGSAENLNHARNWCVINSKKLTN